MTRLIRPVASLNIVLAHNGPGDAAGFLLLGTLPLAIAFALKQLLQNFSLCRILFALQLPAEPLDILVDILGGDPAFVILHAPSRAESTIESSTGNDPTVSAMPQPNKC